MSAYWFLQRVWDIGCGLEFIAMVFRLDDTVGLYPAASYQKVDSHQPVFSLYFAISEVQNQLYRNRVDSKRALLLLSVRVTQHFSVRKYRDLFSWLANERKKGLRVSQQNK